MGIRFFCPQGHKLNVKSFLAGKTGFCPHCNARVETPLTSTRPSSKAAAEEQVIPLAHPLEEEVVLSGPLLDASGPAAAPFPEQATGTIEGPDKGKPTGPDTSEQWWILSQADNQQYGPAPTDLLRQWIQEGRVVAETQIRPVDSPNDPHHWQKAVMRFPEYFSGDGAH